MDFIPAAFRPGGRDRAKDVEDGFSDSTLQQSHATLQASTVVPQSRRGTIVQLNDDPLSVFRHMVGIHSTKSFVANNDKVNLAQHNNLHFDGRVAPNLGIYNRVCHREAVSKRNFKLSSLLINGCLGAQVIVAAALTAMGAANSSNVAVTAFGAINTVIAGILTYLKGSGLPNRLRYYENEWKKIREYIEQRERDFSRPDCKLDVHEIVHVIEQMYEEAKADVQSNTPDNYISISDIKARQSATNPQIPKVQGAHVQGKVKKLQDLELKYGHKITDFLETIAHKEEERLRALEKGIEHNAKGRVGEVAGFARDYEKDFEARKGRAEASVTEVGRDFERDVEARGARFGEFGRDVEARGARLAGLGREAEREGERYAGSVVRMGRAMDEEIHSLAPRKEQG
ncbi:hypothetical protein EJ04DRAFT_590362 [Polyplosphaeria fusca]|uniref:SMODS and SLOG-associating 2TM effector domain-containing protein n=1 Tax=Polyplosphaeria fusca TaxID=682080 RepID=A0A9P4QPX4_9PLEO|nr:hypothetical protein EJ04DRAFT_590362 [Polyplosphaeria fusca]